MRPRPSLDRAVSEAWRSFERAAALRSRVLPAVPILFFGDLHRYSASDLRVVTAGLNPSLAEFPEADLFRRFPLAVNCGRGDQIGYLESLSAYFWTDPYMGWFGNLEPLLNGMGTSYLDGAASTALHTDICSPVATNPTWSQFNKTERTLLMSDGEPLWHELLQALRPNVVVMSVARRRLSLIEFDPLSPWQHIHRILHKADGAPRARPYMVDGRWYAVGGQRTLFVYCPAAQVPLGSISKEQRRKLGPVVADTHRRGP